jgi:hypothetical protein
MLQCTVLTTKFVYCAKKYLNGKRATSIYMPGNISMLAFS